MECFESFRRCDVYALGLVMWEVCRRTVWNGKIFVLIFHWIYCTGSHFFGPYLNIYANSLFYYEFF